MKVKMKVLSIVLLLVITLCGCGKNAGDSGEEEKKKKDGIEYTIHTMESVIADEFLEWSFDGFWNSYDLLPSNTQESHSYFEGEEGMRYFYLEGQVKNISSKDANFYDVVIKIIFDEKYEYSGVLCFDEGYDIEQFPELVPMQSSRFYMQAKVPKEMVDSYKTVSFRWSYDDLESEHEMSEEKMKYHYQIDAKENRADVGAYELYISLGGDASDYNKYEKNTTEESEEISPKEQLKKELQEAADNNRYVWFVKTYEENKDKLGADDTFESLYNDIKSRLKKYDGNYNITMFAGGTYSIEMKDGIGVLEFSHGAKYYVEILGWNFNGKTKEVIDVFTFALSTDSKTPEEWFVTDNILWYYSDDMDVYSVNIDNKDSVMIMACEGNSYQSYNGSGSLK